MWMGMRGAVFILPIALIYVFVTSQTPVADIAKGVIVIALAMLGGSLSGLAYTLAGRRVLRLGVMGKYLAGVITLAPYMFILIYIIGFTKGERLLRAPSAEDLFIASFMALVFGVVMGRSWFGNARRVKKLRDPAT
jgi:drug/metabolite transporter (DMT)-like permease